MQRERARGGGITVALQADDQEDRRTLGPSRQVLLLATQERNELVMDDVHPLLSGRHALADVLS
ncbi:hypothetical protein DQK91_23450, partial [Oceanidesulfovibrio marinus]